MFIFACFLDENAEPPPLPPFPCSPCVTPHTTHHTHNNTRRQTDRDRERRQRKRERDRERETRRETREDNTKDKTKDKTRQEKIKRSREDQDEMCCVCGCVVLTFPVFLFFKITRPSNNYFGIFKITMTNPESFFIFPVFFVCENYHLLFSRNLICNHLSPIVLSMRERRNNHKHNFTTCGQRSKKCQVIIVVLAIHRPPSSNSTCTAHSQGAR